MRLIWLPLRRRNRHTGNRRQASDRSLSRRTGLGVGHDTETVRWRIAPSALLMSALVESRHSTNVGNVVESRQNRA